MLLFKVWVMLGLKKSTSLDLPEPVSKKPFNNICKKLAATALVKASSSMTRAAERLFMLTEKENADQIVALQDGRKLDNVAVSLDGTWQKRGHTSRIGVVFIISIDTGEVLDFVIKSLICHECNAHGKTKDEEYTKWWGKPQIQLHYQPQRFLRQYGNARCY